MLLTDKQTNQCENITCLAMIINKETRVEKIAHCCSVDTRKTVAILFSLYANQGFIWPPHKGSNTPEKFYSPNEALLTSLLVRSCHINIAHHNVECSKLAYNCIYAERVRSATP